MDKTLDEMIRRNLDTAAKALKAVDKLNSLLRGEEAITHIVADLISGLTSGAYLVSHIHPFKDGEKGPFMSRIYLSGAEKGSGHYTIWNDGRVLEGFTENDT